MANSGKDGKVIIPILELTRNHLWVHVPQALGLKVYSQQVNLVTATIINICIINPWTRNLKMILSVEEQEGPEVDKKVDHK